MLPSHCFASSVKAAWHILGRGWTFDLGFSPMVLMLPTQEAAPVARDQSSCGRRLRECSPDGRRLKKRSVELYLQTIQLFPELPAKDCIL